MAEPSAAATGGDNAGQTLSPGEQGVREVQARTIGRDVHGRGSPAGDA
jgi:hypothetical protein